MNDNPQFNAVREVVDAIAGPDLGALQRRLLEECGEKLGQVTTERDYLRSERDFWINNTNHLAELVRELHGVIDEQRALNADLEQRVAVLLRELQYGRD